MSGLKQMISDPIKPDMSSRKLQNLDGVLSYENTPVIRRFLTLYEVDEAEAVSLFGELKKYLWACANSETSIAPVTIIDAMWHNFILFTHDYHVFCHDHFGYFVHHFPADKTERSQRKARDPAAFQERRQAEFTDEIGTIYDLLGLETVVRWYLEFPTIYDDRFFQDRVRPPTVASPKLSAELAAYLQ